MRRHSGAGRRPGSGLEHIDRVRQEVQASPTAKENAAGRHSMLYQWYRLLLHRGVDMIAFEPIRKQLPRPWNQSNEKQCRVIDEGYAVLEGLQAKLPGFENRTGTPTGAPGKPANWPSFAGGPLQAGFTNDPGPWRNPAK